MAVGDGWLGMCMSLSYSTALGKYRPTSIVCDPGLPHVEQLLSVQCDLIIETKTMVSSQLYVTLALQLFYL